jgi:hypothetical protein
VALENLSIWNEFARHLGMRIQAVRSELIDSTKLYMRISPPECCAREVSDSLIEDSAVLDPVVAIIDEGKKMVEEAVVARVWRERQFVLPPPTNEGEAQYQEWLAQQLLEQVGKSGFARVPR